MPSIGASTSTCRRLEVDWPVEADARLGRRLLQSAELARPQKEWHRNRSVRFMPVVLKAPEYLGSPRNEDNQKHIYPTLAFGSSNFLNQRRHHRCTQITGGSQAVM